MVHQPLNDPQNILITGGGLIGGTLAADYATTFPNSTITVYEINENARAELKSALKSVGITNVKIIGSDNLKEASQTADVIDHCVPIDKLKDVQEKITPHMKEGAVITNRGSAQTTSRDQIKGALGNNTDAKHYGIHPVVGRERKGNAPLQIHSGTFKDQTAIMEPLAEDASDADKAAHAKLKAINEKLGFNIKELPPETHDKLLGAMSHENTIALMTMAALQGTDFDDDLASTILRAGAGTKEMWLAILETNAGSILNASEVQDKKLSDFVAALENDDDAELQKLLQEAHDFRMEWPDKDQKIEGLSESLDKMEYTEGAKRKFGRLLTFSTARTLGVKENAAELADELNTHGHQLTDLLNSSVKDSTLVSKYTPKDVLKLLKEDKESLLRELQTYQAHKTMISEEIKKLKFSDQTEKEDVRMTLTGLINHAAANLAQAPAPRREGGGAGFDDLTDPYQPVHINTLG